MTMNAITLDKSEIHEGNLILVNAAHPLRGGAPGELVPVNHSGVLLRREAADALRAILEAISADGQIVPVSGYRSAEEQARIYGDSLRESGAEFTRKYVALPGCSEHQTGLAIDLGLYSERIDFIRPDFPYDGICEAFRRAAPRYGFVERYPAGRERITGIAHEPWHFRYVGFPHSEIMAERKLTLEEYVQFVKNRSQTVHGIELFFVPAAGDSPEIRLPEHAAYRLSGDNVDGFIATVWRKSQ